MTHWRFMWERMRIHLTRSPDRDEMGVAERLEVFPIDILAAASEARSSDIAKKLEPEDRPLVIVARAMGLLEFWQAEINLEKEDSRRSLLQAYQRTWKFIRRKGEEMLVQSTPDKDLLKEEAEHLLFAKLVAIQSVLDPIARKVADLLSPAHAVEQGYFGMNRYPMNELTEKYDPTTKQSLSKEYLKIISEVEALGPLIHQFFDNVLIEVEDQELQSNRIALLQWTLATMERAGDLSKIEMPA